MIHQPRHNSNKMAGRPANLARRGYGLSVMRCFVEFMKPEALGPISPFLASASGWLANR
jgi:hypothetical protein